jgi:hypothetical protein
VPQWKKILFEDSEVIVGVAGQNELLVYSKVADPPKLRLGAPGGGTLGAISFNDLTGGREKEMVLMMGKDHDPDSPGDALKCGSLDTQGLVENSAGADVDMKKISLQTPHRVNFRVPLETGGPPPTPLWPATAPVARDGSGGGAAFISTYQSYISNDLHRPASAAQKALIQTYVDKYSYIDNAAYNWVMGTFVYSGLVP